MNDKDLSLIINKVKELNNMYAAYMNILKFQINEIINERITDINKIEHVLDDLLNASYVNNDLCEKEFYFLINYYKTINLENALFYEKEFLSIIKVEKKPKIKKKTRINNS